MPDASQCTASASGEELWLWEREQFSTRPGFSLAQHPGEPTASACGATGCSQLHHQVNATNAHYPPDLLEPDGVRELPEGANYVKDEEHLWSYGRVAGVTDDHMGSLRQLLEHRKGSFAYTLNDLPGYTGPPAEFIMKPGARAFCKRRQYSPLEEQIRDEKLTEQHDAQFIVERDTRCDFAACPTMPGKKDANGEWTDRRLCQDYRFVNSQMVADNRPLPLPDDIFRSLKGAKVLSKIDMRSGFLQIPIHPDSQHVTSFWWGSKLYQYTRLPFGIKTSVAIFQRIMETELERAGLTHCAKVFVDDILIHSETMEEHLLHLAAVIDALHAVGLRIHPAKSVFATDRVEYLGHLVTPDGLEPVAAKVAAMAQLPEPKNRDDLRSALGLLNYYRCYIPDASAIAQPLNELLRKDAQWEWGPAQQQAYDALKAELCVPGKVLRHAHPDRPLILHTDWSTHGIAAVLGQLDEHGNEYMVACISRSLNKHERQYEAWKGELLAAVWGVKSFRIYLHGPREFELVTDHRPLLWLLTAPAPTGQQARWVLALQEYTFTIRHRPGATNIAADVPSRFPLPTSADTTGARLDTDDSDPYSGPLPQVVFGPVGTGVPVQPYRLVEAPPGLLSQPTAAALPTPAALFTPDGTLTSEGGDRNGAASEYLTNSVAVASYVAAPADRQYRNGMPAAASSSGASTVLEAFSAAPSPASDPACSVSELARVAALAAARNRQYQYHLHAEPDYLAEYHCSALDSWECASSFWAAPEDDCAPADRIQQELLRRRATQWVQGALQSRVAPDCSSGTAGKFTGSSDAVGVQATVSLCTASVNSTFHTAAAAGVVVCELFGGLCAGLEMALRNGVRIHSYIYVDSDPTCQEIAQHRIFQLMAQYPHLLPASAVAHAFDSLPQDVWQITNAHLASLSERLPQQWLVVGGWACQDLSPAGTCTGLEGDRSNTFFPMLQIIGTLQQLQRRLPPAYLIENTAFQHNWKSVVIREAHFQYVCAALGTPVCIDAAQFNSYAHRLRNYWTNLCGAKLLTAAITQVHRRPHLQVQHILASGRYASIATRDDRAPYYQCNRKGQPLSAWPTIVAYPQSHAFRNGEQGAVWDSNTGQWSEPTADECELAMGYQQGSTAAPDVSEQQRRAAMGRCMDANVMQALFAISSAWFRHQHWAKAPVQFSIAVNTAQAQPANSCPQGLAGCLTGGRSTHDVLSATYQQHILSSTAEIQDQAAAETQDPASTGGRSGLDIWDDEQLLYYLKEQQYQTGTTHAERTRVRKRAALYVLAIDGRLFRVMPDGSKREVPRKEARAQLIADYHENCGHYGVRRTAALIQNVYWWHGILTDVALAVSKCKLCGRVRTSFSAQHPTLNPLPINGMFYRFGCDLAGPFPKTKSGSVYVMVVIEYFSKYLHVIPLPNKQASTTAAAFSQHILARYGSMAELVTDAGTEWTEDFAALLAQALIDHRRTSAGHPQADGLAERAVQTVKRALKKLCAQLGHKDDWDQHLPMLMLGYNCSPQKSTGLSPYMMMYARTPIIPPAIRERMSEPFDFDSTTAAVKDFLARKKLVQQHYLVAGDNLRIAQHRDMLRYAVVRSGKFLPKVRRFEPGDYIYVSTNAKTTLDIKARPLILRVKEVRPSGVLIVEGRCGRSVSVHSTKCAPCHLPDIDPRIDPTLAVPGEETQCEVCHQSDDGAYMLLCDSCNKARHLYCAEPPLEAVPAGTWLCSDCVSQGKTAELVEQQRVQDHELEMQQQRADDLTPSEKKAKQLHDRLVQRTFFDEQTNLPKRFWGRISFVGPGAGDNLLITYQDGDRETCTIGKMRGRQIKIMPAGTQLPSDVCIPDPVAAAVAMCVSLSGSSTMSLPSDWNLQTPQGVARALSLLLPGQYAQAHLTKIANSIKALAEKGDKGGWVPTTVAELQPLARLVDFSGCQSFLDPFAGSGTIAAFFNSMGYAMLQNDWDGRWPQVALHADALQPAFYLAHPVQVIVTSPPFCVLDIAVPLLAQAAAVMACIHVPGHWIASATSPRQQWLHGMQQQGRLHIIMGLDRGPIGRKCAFLLVFATADMKKQMLRTADSSTILTFAQANPPCNSAV